MKFGDIVDAASAASLQTSWLHQTLSPASDFGSRAYEQVTPYRPGQEALAREHACGIVDLARKAGLERIEAMRDALRNCADPAGAMSRAAMGDTLDDAHFLELLRFLDVAVGVDPRRMSPATDELASALGRGRAGKFAFYLADEFDAALAPARTQARSTQAQYDAARARLCSRVAQAIGREDLAGGEFIVMRDEVEALPAGLRVVREAPTYYLCEIELDESALAALRRRDEAKDEVAAIEDRVRRTLSDGVRDALPALVGLVDGLAQFDIRLAQAKFTVQYDCVAAEMVDARALTFTDASYLPVKEELAKQGRSYEPISVDLRDIAVLTGPNMGGKTVALRTCGFIALLAAFGIPVPAKRARCALFEEIAWLGVGSQDGADGLLSSFALEVVRLRELLDRPVARMLLLIDEFARTTTPHEGKVLLTAVLRGLRRRERLALAATHHAGVAEEAGVRHLGVRGLREVPPRAEGTDLQTALGLLAEAMDYSIAEVGSEGAGQADAIALAQLLGLDDDIVMEAKEGLWTR